MARPCHGGLHWDNINETCNRPEKAKCHQQSSSVDRKNTKWKRKNSKGKRKNSRGKRKKSRGNRKNSRGNRKIAGVNRNTVETDKNRNNHANEITTTNNFDFNDDGKNNKYVFALILVSL